MKQIKTTKMQRLKQRGILGMMLLCCAMLFSRPWAKNYPMPPPLWVLADDGALPYMLEEPEPPPHYGYLSDTVGINDMADIEAVVLAPPARRVPPLAPLSAEAVENLTNFHYLTNRIFLVDPETILLPSDIDVHGFLEADLTIDNTLDGPKVLIFHTHSGEMFTDSNPAYPMTGVMGVGKYLADILENHHGIATIHHTQRFDMIDGASHRPGAYERMEPAIRRILEENPSVQVVIDLHRDGVGPNAPAFVHYIGEVPTAQIMFFNGLSRQNRNGQAVNIDRLPNPYQQENLNFSFRLQLAANRLYPGLTRRVYLRAFRYSLHMMPLSTLVEVGNQHNTLQQAKNAMYPLANIIAAVVLYGE